MSEDTLLDAARACILAVGWKRTTMTDVARRAAVSRATVYRNWPDTHALLSDLLTRELSAVVAAGPVDAGGEVVAQLAAGICHTVAALRGNELFRRIVEVDPELLLPYLLTRRGRVQDFMLARIAEVIEQGQSVGSVRAGDPALLARTVVLATYGFTFSTRTMTGESPTADRISVEQLDAELRLLLERLLTP